MRQSMNIIFAAILWLASVTALHAHEGATGIVKERMDAFVETRQQMKQMRGAIAESEFVAVANISARMQIWANKMADYFPEGSDQSPSEAAPAIWSDPDGFAAKLVSYQTSIRALGDAASSGDRDSTIKAFSALGQSCKSCHQTYRK